MTSLLLRALKGENTGRPPIWLMRQAGRFLPPYRKLREKYSIAELFHTPELAAEVTRMPVEILGVDAAIIFSDILTVTEMVGYRVIFPEGASPYVEKDVVSTPTYVAETIRLLKPYHPIIGFCGGPYTVAKYMNAINHSMLEKITQASIEYLQMQVEAGADVIQIFDSWAGLLPPEEFHDLSLRYLKPLIASLSVPVIIFCRGATKYVKELVSLNPTAISFDSDRKMAELLPEVPPHIALQGNLSPETLRGSLSLLQQETHALLASMKGQRRFIFNLGHGVLPDTPLENGQWLVKAVSGSS